MEATINASAMKVATMSTMLPFSEKIAKHKKERKEKRSGAGLEDFQINAFRRGCRR